MSKVHYKNDVRRVVLTWLCCVAAAAPASAESPFRQQIAAGACGIEGRAALGQFTPLREREMDAALQAVGVWPLAWLKPTSLMVCVDLREQFALGWFVDGKSEAIAAWVAQLTAQHGAANWLGGWVDPTGTARTLAPQWGRWKVLIAADGMTTTFAPGVPWIDRVTLRVGRGCDATSPVASGTWSAPSTKWLHSVSERRQGRERVCMTDVSLPSGPSAGQLSAVEPGVAPPSSEPVPWHIDIVTLRPAGAATKDAVGALLHALAGAAYVPQLAPAAPLIATDPCASLGLGTKPWVRCSLAAKPVTWGYSGYLLGTMGPTLALDPSRTWGGALGLAGRFVNRRYLGLALGGNGHIGWHHGLTGEARFGAGLGKGFGLRHHGHVALLLGAAAGHIGNGRVGVYGELATLWPLGPLALDLAVARVVTSGDDVWRTSSRLLIPVGRVATVSLGGQFTDGDVRRMVWHLGFGLRGR